MKFLKQSFLFAALMMTVSANAQSGDWLTELPDNVPVRELSIPGAHDAGTGHGFTNSFLASFSGVTQSLDIPGQWAAGVRAFDLRPTYSADVDGKLQIYHGILETKISFKAALQALVDKLTASPGEMAIVLMRHESDSDGNSEAWAGAVADLFTEFDDYIATYSPNMTLADARGKILVLSRDSFSSAKAGMISGWSHSENFDDQKKGVIALGRNKAMLYAQDFYECQTSDRKYAAVTALLDYSTTHTSTTNWIINHVSGYIGSMGTSSNVNSLAQALNGKVADYIGQGEGGRTGIVMMDFAGTKEYNGYTMNGDKLVETVIAQNNKYIETPAGLVPTVARQNSAASDDRIFDLNGRCVGNGADILNLMPPGLYIFNRQKVFVR